MRFFRLLLLFTGVISAVSMADLWHRDTGVVHDNVEEDKSHGSTPTPRSQTEHKQFARRHIRVYTAVAKNSSDVAELGKFVRSKVQPGKEGAINTLIRDDKIFGWAGLILDDAAKEEIARHEGVSGIRERLEIREIRVLPEKDWSQKLARRAGKWVKQMNADDSLAAISQYS
jgi:hypothetical protein